MMSCGINIASTRRFSRPTVRGITAADATLNSASKMAEVAKNMVVFGVTVRLDGWMVGWLDGWLVTLRRISQSIYVFLQAS